MNKLFKQYNVALRFFLVLCLVFVSGVLASHGLSHKINGANSAKIFSLESQSLIKSSPSHDLSDCLQCFSAAIFHNTIFIAFAVGAFVAFRLLFLTQISNRVKLAYLQSSFLSRAPPFLS